MSEREALLDAIAEVILEDGYRHATATSISERAGLDALAFDVHFASVEQCLIAAHESTTQRAFSAAYAAYASCKGTWAEAVHEALGGMLAFFAEHPAATHLWAVEARHAGHQLIPAVDSATQRVIELLEPGFADAAESDPPPRVAAEMVAGGLFEMIRLHTVDGRVQALPEALPIATMITLTPFVGRTRASEIAKPDRSPPGTS